jgi:hypothetical protein
MIIINKKRGNMEHFLNNQASENVLYSMASISHPSKDSRESEYAHVTLAKGLL